MQSVREHPPTFAAAMAAFLASLASDLQPIVADALPAVSDGTVTLGVALVLGVAGGLVGRAAERWTIPWHQPDGEPH